MNLNINSEVTVALLKNDTWTVFDVYNQAVKHDGILFINKRLIMEDAKSKYIRRRNMTGVLFKTFIVVSLLHIVKIIVFKERVIATRQV